MKEADWTQVSRSFDIYARYNRQQLAWETLCAIDAAIPAMWPRLAREFATTADLDRRDAILREIGMRVEK